MCDDEMPDEAPARIWSRWRRGTGLSPGHNKMGRPGYFALAPRVMLSAGNGKIGKSLVFLVALGWSWLVYFSKA